MTPSLDETANKLRAEGELDEEKYLKLRANTRNGLAIMRMVLGAGIVLQFLYKGVALDTLLLAGLALMLLSFIRRRFLLEYDLAVYLYNFGTPYQGRLLHVSPSKKYRTGGARIAYEFTLPDGTARSDVCHVNDINIDLPSGTLLKDIYKDHGNTLTVYYDAQSDKSFPELPGKTQYFRLRKTWE